MRWLAVWLVLTGVFFAGQLVASLFSGWAYTREDFAHLVAIPLVQLAAVWIVVLVRRSIKPPPPAPGKPASRPASER